MKRNIIILALLPLFAAGLFAQTIDGIGGQGGMLFESGGSARSLAMGQAYTGIANQGEAVLYNPAGLGQIHTPKVALMGGSLYAGAMQSVVSFNLPWSTFGTFGLAYVGAFSSLDEGDIVNADGSPITGEDISANMSQSGVIISYAKKVGFFSVGLAPKIMFGTLSEEQALAFDVDAGAMFYPIHFVETLPYDMITVGVSLKNLLGATMDYTGSEMEQPNSRIVRAGLGVKPLRSDLVMLGADISYTLDDNGAFGWYAGFELNPIQYLSLRAGANYKDFSFGLGINTDVARSVGLNINYAFVMNHASEFELNPVHKVSLNVDLRSISGLWLESSPASLTSPSQYAEIYVNGASEFKGHTKRWVFEITDRGGNVHYRQARDVYTEVDELPAKFTWNGVDNIRGGQVDDGQYFYKITLIDKMSDQIVYTGSLLRISWQGFGR